MLFNSIDFLYFFVIVTIAFYALPHKFRWILLLFASCYFYMAFVPIYILILLGTIVIDYFAGIFIAKARVLSTKKLILIISIISNIGILCLFKYYNFFLENLIALLEGFDLNIEKPPYLNILLPIGLSFHTFQALSYTIEVYRGNQKPETHFGIYALYVLFYPQLVAGPIERPQNIIHQFHEEKKFDWINIIEGLKLIFWGLFKKIVIADRLSPFVNMVFENPNEWQGIPIILAIIFFSIQIYCDFSGYSDIAIGTAKTMGFDLMLNFNRPYLSKSLGEFWSKWHVSLSTWFRDYVYISLGGNRISRQRTYFNLLFIFILSGLWHGSNWTFIIWGIFHGCFLIIERIFSIEKYTNKTLPIFWFIYTFIIVSIGWVFFRAETISDALIIFKNAAILSKDKIGWYMFGNYKYELIVGLCAIMVLVFLEVKKTNNGIDVFKNLPKFIRIFVYILFLVLFLLFGAFHNSSEFIYFQF